MCLALRGLVKFMGKSSMNGCSASSSSSSYSCLPKVLIVQKHPTFNCNKTKKWMGKSKLSFNDRKKTLWSFPSMCLFQLVLRVPEIKMRKRFKLTCLALSLFPRVSCIITFSLISFLKQRDARQARKKVMLQISRPFK